MQKGNLFLKTDNGLEFIKECDEKEYLELMFATPGHYAFTPISAKQPTIQDLNDFANRAMQKSIIDNNVKDKAAFFNKKSISDWSAVAGVLATGIAIWEYVIKPMIKHFLK